LFKFLSLVSGEIGALPEFAFLSTNDVYGNGSCDRKTITPYSERLTQMEEKFNIFWSFLRIVVEQVFGGNCRPLGHFVVASPILLEEVHHDNRGVLQAA
jgi:hypothetical protein